MTNMHGDGGEEDFTTDITQLAHDQQRIGFQGQYNVNAAGCRVQAREVTLLLLCRLNTSPYH